MGCASRARIAITQPAEHNIAGLHRIAILELEGEKGSGKIARACLVKAFYDNKHFEIVDPSQLARFRNFVMPDGRMSLPAAMEAASLARVDAVLVGQVISFNVVDDKIKDPNAVSGDKLRERGFSSGAFGVGTDNSEAILREGTATISVQLVDVNTGSVRAAHQASQRSKTKITVGQGDSTSRDKLLETLMELASQEVVAALAPHNRVVEVALATPIYSRGYSSVVKGNKLAADGDWSGAQTAWKHAIHSNPDNHAALHNLALASELQKDYSAATHWIDLAVEKTKSPAYIATRDRIRLRQRDFQLAQAQSQARQLASKAKDDLGLPQISADAQPANYSAEVVRLPQAEEIGPGATGKSP